MSEKEIAKRAHIGTSTFSYDCSVHIPLPIVCAQQSGPELGVSNLLQRD
jgi:hypothetical protein